MVSDRLTRGAVYFGYVEVSNLDDLQRWAPYDKTLNPGTATLFESKAECFEQCRFDSSANN